ncbi:MAG: hypothetical protein C5B48_02730 [Candidatus Rokuibacteriota bacterium]|nr:MAG: hypothetical protein C5B48_02730 [Candidatus Rokubacteria bacterium]
MMGARAMGADPSLAGRLGVRLATCVLLAARLLLATAAAQPAADQPVVARVTVKTASDLLRFMARGLDVLETRDGDDLFIVTTPAEVDQLRIEGWTISIDTAHTSLIRRQQQEQRQRWLAAQPPRERLFLGGYRTVPEMRAFLDDMAAQYPNLAEVFVYGASWERLTGGAAAGHDLFGINLTNKQRAGPKPTLFLMAAIHARELSTSELALRFVDYLLANYGVDADATWLLDEHLVVVVPVVNPDGRVLAEQGYLQRKNTDTSMGTCSIPNIGIDLNRNSSFKWGTVDGPGQSPCAETYPGPVPVSEPETAALQALVRSLFPDQRGPNDTDASPITATGLLITLHSYSDLVMWPWGFTSVPAPNAADLSAIGRKFAAYNRYTPQQSVRLYPTSGTTDDWAYGELGIAAFTFEVGPGGGACGGFFPPFSCLDGGVGGSFWPRNLPAFLYAARIARTPFQIVQGPTAEATTATLRDDGKIDVDVLLDGQDNGGRPIAAAEYYLDTPPWNGGTPIALAPSDGAFDSAVEVASAVLEPFTERHIVFARGQDSAGAWGAVRAVFTPDPNCPATLSPLSQSFGSGGGSGTVTVTVANGCAWTAATVSPWITVTNAAGGVGPGEVSYTVAANAGGVTRTGAIAVAGRSIPIVESSQPAAPDLRETQVSGPPAAQPGTSISVSDTTENLGELSARASTTRFYLSITGLKNASAKLLGGSRAVPALDPGAMSSGTATVTIPSTTALGTYVLVACADDTHVVHEGNETDNCVASTAPTQVTRPNLIAASVSDPPLAAARGSSFSVTDTVTNQGEVAAKATTTRYYLSVDTKKSSGDRRLTGSRLVPSLAAGASSTDTVRVTIPASTPPGSYYLVACADATALVTETKERDNCLASAAQVSVGP